MMFLKTIKTFFVIPFIVSQCYSMNLSEKEFRNDLKPQPRMRSTTPLPNGVNLSEKALHSDFGTQHRVHSVTPSPNNVNSPVKASRSDFGIQHRVHSVTPSPNNVNLPVKASRSDFGTQYRIHSVTPSPNNVNLPIKASRSDFGTQHRVHSITPSPNNVNLPVKASRSDLKHQPGMHSVTPPHKCIRRSMSTTDLLALIGESYVSKITGIMPSDDVFGPVSTLKINIRNGMHKSIAVMNLPAVDDSTPNFVTNSQSNLITRDPVSNVTKHIKSHEVTSNDHLNNLLTNNSQDIVSLADYSDSVENLHDQITSADTVDNANEQRINLREMRGNIRSADEWQQHSNNSRSYNSTELNINSAAEQELQTQGNGAEFFEPTMNSQLNSKVYSSFTSQTEIKSDTSHAQHINKHKHVIHQSSLRNSITHNGTISHRSQNRFPSQHRKLKSFSEYGYQQSALNDYCIRKQNTSILSNSTALHTPNEEILHQHAGYYTKSKTARLSIEANHQNEQNTNHSTPELMNNPRISLVQSFTNFALSSINRNLAMSSPYFNLNNNEQITDVDDSSLVPTNESDIANVVQSETLLNNLVNRCSQRNMRRRRIVLLSIDGGGSRGIIPLTILNRLRKDFICELGGEQIQFPFSMIAGTSVGALIGTALSLGKIEQVNENFMTMVSRIFHASCWHKLKTMWGIMGPSYESVGRAQVISEMLQDTDLNSLSVPLLIPFFSSSTRDTIWYKSNARHPRFELFDVLMMTSAAPTYFPAHICYSNDQQIVGIDGGIWANNPAYELYSVVRKKYCDDYITLVSLGTGTCAPFDPRDHQSTGLIQWARLFPEITIQALSNHVNNKLSMLDMSSDSAVHDPLFRFIRIQVNNLALDEVVTDSTDSHFLHSLGQRALRTIDTPSESNYAKYREVLGLLTDITRENADISNEQFDLSDFSHIEDE